MSTDRTRALAELRLIDVGDVGAALSQAEQIAPEHLQLMGEEAEALADRVRNAGLFREHGGRGPDSPHRQNIRDAI